MKKVLITLCMMLALGMSIEAGAQRHRHTPQQELVDSTNKDVVEVYSDTTDTTGATTVEYYGWDDEDDAKMKKGIDRFIESLDGKDVAGMLFVLGVMLIIFVLAPVFIIIALFYFINKNRKQKMKLAQMAMQQGQPIPEQLLEEKPESADEEYNKGLRQCFVGVGLMVFLGYAAGHVGFGIGALVFCIGLGKVVAGMTAQKKNKRNNEII